MSKWWWIGSLTYDPYSEDHFERLDVIGGNDFSTKVWMIFNSYTFSSDKTILNGIIDGLRFLKENDIKVVWKKEFRAALKYLNAYGGSVLLDLLSEEEICRIFLTKILELLGGDSNGMDFEAGDTDDIYSDDSDVEDGDEDIDGLPQKAIDYLNSIPQKAIYVDYGDEVIVKRVRDGSLLKPFVIPNEKEKLRLMANIVKESLGKRENEIIILKQEKNERYEVVSIKKP